MILFTDTDNYQTRTESTLLISAKTRLILLFLSFSTNAILASALFWRQSTTHIEDVLCVLMFFTTFPYITSLYENAIATIARYVRVVQSWPLTEIKQSISCSNSRTSFIGILRLQPCMVRSKHWRYGCTQMNHSSCVHIQKGYPESIDSSTPTTTSKRKMGAAMIIAAMKISTCFLLVT